MVRKIRTFHPMNALAMETRDLARRLENTKRVDGLTREQARHDVARTLHIAPGTLESVSRQRVKDPLRLAGIRDRLMAAVVDDIQKQIARLTHDLECLLATGADRASPAVCEAQDAIDAAKEALGGAVK